MPEPRKRVAQQKEGSVQRFRSLAFGGPFTARGGGPLPAGTQAPAPQPTSFLTHSEPYVYHSPAFFQAAPPPVGVQLNFPIATAPTTAPQTPAQLFQTGLIFVAPKSPVIKRAVSAAPGMPMSAAPAAPPPHSSEGR